MSNAFDNRPLLVRLQDRIEKLDPEGHRGATPVDVELHRQSVEEIARLSAAVTALSKNVIEKTREDFNATLNNLRGMGASIDGGNAYKRDLLDAVVGALALGAQNSNPPPSSHWATRFWDIGREERGLHEELVAALKLTRENLRACKATIHLAGGFDTAYVDDAQAAMKVAYAVLAKAGA